MKAMKAFCKKVYGVSLLGQTCMVLACSGRQKTWLFLQC